RASRTGAEGIQFTEACNINSSLSVFGKVVKALADGSPHVAYRESKLTHLLSNSLGGNSKTILVVTIKNTVKLNLDKASQQNLYLRNLLDVCLRELQRLYAEGSNIEHPLLRNKLGIAGVEGDADQGSPSKRMKLALTAAGQESKAEGASSSDVVITKNVQEGWKAQLVSIYVVPFLPILVGVNITSAAETLEKLAEAKAYGSRLESTIAEMADQIARLKVQRKEVLEAYESFRTKHDATVERLEKAESAEVTLR
ncbi:Kif5b, partial [Symbiodinium sp. KB8]